MNYAYTKETEKMKKGAFNLAMEVLDILKHQKEDVKFIFNTKSRNLNFLILFTGKILLRKNTKPKLRKKGNTQNRQMNRLIQSIALKIKAL